MGQFGFGECKRIDGLIPVKEGLNMLSKRERMAWIFVIIIAVVSTFFITSKSLIVSQNKKDNTPPVETPTDIEREAEQWFTSTILPKKYLPIPPRYQYTQENIDVPLLVYQGYINQQAPWINYPEQIVLRAFYPPPESEGFVPTKVAIYYDTVDILTVIVTTSGPFVTVEKRFDFVKVNDVWKIVWVGQRSISLN
jgi:hypothetical protein